MTALKKLHFELKFALAPSAVFEATFKSASRASTMLLNKITCAHIFVKYFNSKYVVRITCAMQLQTHSGKDGSVKRVVITSR